MTGTKERPENLEILTKVFENARIQFFSIFYPGTGFPELSQLSVRNGKHFTIHDGPSLLYTSTSLSQIFTDIASNVEHRSYSTIHIQLYEEWRISGTFTVDKSMKLGFWISLIIENTDQIEYFELIAPSGKHYHKIYSYFLKSIILQSFKDAKFTNPTNYMICR